MGMSRGGRSSCASDQARQSVFFFGRACKYRRSTLLRPLQSLAIGDALLACPGAVHGNGVYHAAHLSIRSLEDLQQD